MKIYKQTSDRYLYCFDFEYDTEIIIFCRQLKSIVGFSVFNFYDKKWRFNDISVMEKIIEQYPDISVDSNMQDDIDLYELKKQQEKLKLKKANEIKQTTTTDFIVNDIKLPLRSYQKLGVEFIINNNGRAIIADSPGLGKSVQALAYITHLKLEKSLIISPASVKWSWYSEVEKFTKLKAVVIDSQTKLTDDLYNENQIFIINYDIIKKFFEKLKSLRWDCLVCDESQYCKNYKSIRTQLTKKLAKKISNVILLSGTPMLNRPVELFTSLQMIDNSSWNDYYGYTRRYCGGFKDRYGWNVNGASNLEELYQRINHYFIRRKKEDVLTELPSKQHIDIPIQLSSEALKNYNLIENNFISYLKNVKDKTNVEIQKSLSAEILVKLNELRMITSLGKVDSAKEVIENVINDGEKIVVFSNFNEPLEVLYDYFKNKCVKITGKNNDAERRVSIDKFQNDDNIKIFLGGIKSCGTGITLTAGSNVLFLDFSWTPADHLQASDRIHRIGQTAKKVIIYQMFSKGTIDEKMKAILNRKQKIIDQVIDGKINKTKDVNMFKELIDSYE